MGRNFILNIELKRESSLERIKKQLLQNIYYLTFLEVDIYSYTFVSSTNTLYRLQGNKLLSVPIEDLANTMLQQRVQSLSNIDKVFDPINYLLSPFKHPHAFMKGEYFLTSPQTTFKGEIINIIAQGGSVIIDGAPGTGKTLLTYDLVKYWMHAGKKITLIHGTDFTPAQDIFVQHYGWHIQPISQFSLKNCDLVVIDEAQTLSYEQAETLRQHLQKAQIPAVFSIDAGYYLFGTGKRIDILGYLEKHFVATVFELKMVMRYNKEMYSFAQQLLDQKNELPYEYFPNVSVSYFSTLEDAHSFFDVCKQTQWFLVDCFQFERVMMQDILDKAFNRVCIILDERFHYKANGRIAATRNNAAYDPLKILYHTIVRSRNQLQIVVIGNIPVLKHILHLLNKPIGH